MCSMCESHDAGHNWALVLAASEVHAVPHGMMKIVLATEMFTVAELSQSPRAAGEWAA